MNTEQTNNPSPETPASSAEILTCNDGVGALREAWIKKEERWLEARKEVKATALREMRLRQIADEARLEYEYASAPTESSSATTGDSDAGRKGKHGTT